MPKIATQPITIRSYHKSDAPACRKLYVQGIIGGSIAENDTGVDIDDIDAAYMKARGNHLWVAEDAEGEIVGMLGVQKDEMGSALIRRLRVRADQRRRGIGSSLMETALKFCRDHNYLKVTLDTFLHREMALSLFEKFNFHHTRSKTVGGKELLYFYLDLYQREGRKHG